ncbi:GntR family transcriptional regulator [Bacillus licheniformis]|nr:GntR family transcriptional regulator [Bacillus licheniformis]
MAEALGVSRTPVREALQLLESQGFVEMKPGKKQRSRSFIPMMRWPSILRSHISRLWRQNWLRRFDGRRDRRAQKLAAQYETAFKEERNHDAAELDEQFHH